MRHDTSKKCWDVYFNAIKKEDWEQAKASLEHLNNIEQDNPQVQLKLGDVYQRMGETFKAIKAYHKSAWIHEKQGFIQKALALYKVILRLDPDNSEAIKQSKRLIMEIETSKKIPSLEEIRHSIGTKETVQEIKIESRTPIEAAKEPEQSMWMDIEETEKSEVQPSEGVEGFIERTSYSPEESSLTSPPKESTLFAPTIFSSLPEEEIKFLIKTINPKIYSSGKTVLKEGDTGDSIFFIKSGHAKVVAHILGKEIELANLSAGDLFGEVAFITGRPRTASVIAIDALEVLEFDKSILKNIFEIHPEILERLHDFYQCRVQDTIQKVKKEIKR
ncbi:MAG: cyclic nucleotide-binding domain-containing protein [Nitrospirota bacterium]